MIFCLFTGHGNTLTFQFRFIIRARFHVIRIDEVIVILILHVALRRKQRILDQNMCEKSVSWVYFRNLRKYNKEQPFY